MVTCRLCTWLCGRFCGGDPWKIAYQWEVDYSHQWGPAEPDDAIRERWATARELQDHTPEAALAIHLELAEAGSAFSMVWAGRSYEHGIGTAKDIASAEDFYRRALSAGSWIATLMYASLLFKRGAHDKWQSTLEDGVAKGFAPAAFRLADYRYKLSPSRKTAGEVRHLLETAMEAGHPGARTLLAQWTAQGKFGLSRIPEGFRMITAEVRALRESADSSSLADEHSLPAKSGGRAVVGS